MKCYSHPATDAVAVCKSCGRALCHECTAEVGRSCACRDRCEADVEKLNDMIVRGSSVYQKTSGVYVRSGVFLIVMGFLFAGFGVFVLGSEQPNYFFLILGILFAVYGAFQFLTAKRYKER